MRQKRATAVKVRKTFAVVVDGDTEVWYLQMLKRNERSINVNIEPKIPQKKRLSEQFEMVVNLSGDYTEVFWIIDFDTLVSEAKDAKKGAKNSIQAFLAYRKEIKSKYRNITVIVNNPCLEFWLLLHFERTSKYFSSCEGAEKQLKKHLKDYEKTQKYYTKQNNDIYLQLKSRLATAINNAKQLGCFNSDSTNKAMSEMQLFFEADELGQLF
ncbi:RloB-like protein [Chitinophaga ginsengisegetis]|uniref:RloB-like protein n=1 Tax=Chitinophaga ginsengisegetis TaxID=393003 RepID=A0A1T5PB70_9BACT|nr:RloB family protein [Chitinophaga ginsengisegetis]SKD09853.1 RloB-like protein [Chitinophaga ginsengisegetis]